MKSLTLSLGSRFLASEDLHHRQITTLSRSLQKFWSSDLRMQHYNNCSLAEKTKNSYETGIKQFYKFCKKYHIEQLGPILPTSENVLRLFATDLASTVSHATIKVYLTAVKHLHFQHNYDLPLNQFNRLQYLLRGIKRYQGTVNRTHPPICKSSTTYYALVKVAT